jgi:hypothetical protein
MERRSPTKSHNPSLKWQVVLVTGVLAVPGCLAGAIVGVCLGGFITCCILGGVIGAMFGGFMEAWPAAGPERPPTGLNGRGPARPFDFD